MLISQEAVMRTRSYSSYDRSDTTLCGSGHVIDTTLCGSGHVTDTALCGSGHVTDPTQ